jgi:hypothetical protein
VTDPGFDLDIVERALAILDEEWRAWVAQQGGRVSPDGVSPAPGEPERHGGGGSP